MARRKEPVLEAPGLAESAGFRIRYHPLGAAKEAFECRDPEILLAGPAGCLAGWTRLKYRRGIRNSGRDISLSEFYLKFNGLKSSIPPSWDTTLPTYLHSLGDDSVMFYNRVVAVYQSGVKSMIQVNLKDERFICCTPDHPIMTSNGFELAGNLKSSSRVTCIGSMDSKGFGGRDLSARPPRVIVDTKYHPFGWRHEVGGRYVYYRVPRARLIVEAHMNSLPYDEYLHILKNNEGLALSLIYLPSDLEVHHLDEDTLNDDISNLSAISKAEHARIHGGDNRYNFNFDSTREVEFGNIQSCKDEMTYDIQMESPANNFCANDLVVHNTGKSLGALQKLHLAMGKYPNAKAFMARKTRVSMTNSCMATYQKHVLKPQDRVHLHKQDQVFNYPNGSLIAIVGLDDPERIKSTDWDMGFVQEVTECTENDWEICTTRLRNWVMPYQQLIADCNPDRPTHWIKKRCDKGLTKMLISVHRDNPKLWIDSLQRWTVEGEQYLSKLDRLTGVRRARLYSGQWAAAEGAVYDEWDPGVHMIDRNKMPANYWDWNHFWSIDWGYQHPFCWQDWIEDPDTGQIYLNRQIYRTKYLVEDAARDILELTKGYQPVAIICDHDAGDRATFERHTGYMTLPAYKPIQPGIQAVKKRLRADWCHKGPGVMIIRDSLYEVDKELEDAGKPTCTEQEIDGYVWDKGHNENVNSKKDEVPIDRDNHGLDPLRYKVAFMDSLADDPEDIEGTLFLGDESEVMISPY